MTEYKYAFDKYDAERMAKAVGRDISVSTKQAIELCSTLRRKNLQAAKQLLVDVIEMRKPIKFNRFTNGIGHKKGKLGAGAYPQKAAMAFLDLLSSVEINAQNKGLNTGQLAIIHICAQKASKPMHYGRQRRSEFKRSHVEIVVAEEKQKKKAKTEKKEEIKKEEKKAEAAKPEVKKEAKEVKKDVPKEEKKEVKKEAPKEAKPEPKEMKKEEQKEAEKEEPKPKEAPKEAKKEEAEK